MNIVIGNLNDDIKRFLRKEKIKSPTLVINKMCNVKYITNPIYVYIPYGRINKAGLLENTMVHIEELIITTNVIKIYYGDKRNDEFFKRIKDIYKVDVERINVR